MGAACRLMPKQHAFIYPFVHIAYFYTHFYIHFFAHFFIWYEWVNVVRPQIYVFTSDLIRNDILPCVRVHSIESKFIVSLPLSIAPLCRGRNNIIIVWGLGMIWELDLMKEFSDNHEREIYIFFDQMTDWLWETKKWFLVFYMDLNIQVQFSPS